MVGGSQLAHRAPYSCEIFFQLMSSNDILCVGIFPSLASNHGDLVKGVATNIIPLLWFGVTRGSHTTSESAFILREWTCGEARLVVWRRGDSFSKNGECRFFSSGGEEAAFSIL
jgi:hypothetical protein